MPPLDYSIVPIKTTDFPETTSMSEVKEILVNTTTEKSKVIPKENVRFPASQITEIGDTIQAVTDLKEATETAAGEAAQSATDAEAARDASIAKVGATVVDVLGTSAENAASQRLASELNTSKGRAENNAKITFPKTLNTYYNIYGKYGYYDNAVSSFKIPILPNMNLGYKGLLAGSASICEFGDKGEILRLYTADNATNVDGIGIFEFTTSAFTMYIGVCSLNGIVELWNKSGAVYDYEIPNVSDVFIESKKMLDSINTLEIKEVTGKTSRLGSINYEPFPLTGYAHICLYGQSLSTGDNSYVPVTGVLTPVVEDTFMIGTTPTSISGNLSQLKASIGDNPNGGECPVVNATYALKKMLNKTPYRGVKLIGVSAGVGGKTIEELSKNTGSIYTDRFISSLNAIKTSVGSEPVVCPAIVWMQGEFNQSLATTTTVDQYKAMVNTLKNDMQSDIMSIYGQSEKPLFFVYQTSALFTPRFPVVGQALLEFANENSDVILMNPHYFCPTTDSGHLSANGYRWFGEYIAKAVFDTLNYGNRYGAVTPEKFTIKDNNSVIIDFKTPNPPIVFDILQLGAQINYGFAIYKDDVEVAIKSIRIISSTQIELKSDYFETYTKLEVEYAGEKTNGRGNVRDSDNYVAGSIFLDDNYIYTENASSVQGYNDSRQTYIDLGVKYVSEGVSIYGKPYPMCNWLNTFRIII